MISYICASHNEKILYANLMRSKIVGERGVYVESDCTNVMRAYNWLSGGKGMCCFVHHDVFLPDDFETKMLKGIAQVNAIDHDFGVIGVAGAKLVKGKRIIYGNVKDRGEIFNTFKDDVPVEVDTLDELLLITKGDFLFDENIPGTHFYGADICMLAKQQGRKNYCINAYVEHNSSLKHGHENRPADFEPCKQYFRKKWISCLPIVTTCCTVV